MNRTTIHMSAALLLTLFTTFNAGTARADTAPAAAAGTTAPAAEQSVLERFRSFTGQRTADNLIRLFTAPATADSVRQNPEVGISDGKATVELTLTLGGGTTSVNFACIEGSLISSKSDQNGVWHLVVLPNAGSVKSSIIIQQGNVSRTVPLTVAPPLAGDLSLSGFVLYLKNSDADPKQRVDLNGDGIIDYQDDYIHTANVVVVRNADVHDPSTRNKRARDLTPVRPKL